MEVQRSGSGLAFPGLTRRPCPPCNLRTTQFVVGFLGSFRVGRLLHGTTEVGWGDWIRTSLLTPKAARSVTTAQIHPHSQRTVPYMAANIVELLHCCCTGLTTERNATDTNRRPFRGLCRVSGAFTVSCLRNPCPCPRTDRGSFCHASKPYSPSASSSPCTPISEDEL